MFSCSGWAVLLCYWYLVWAPLPGSEHYSSWGQDCQPQDCAVHLSNTGTCQPPPCTLPSPGSMPVAPLGTGLSLSLRGSVGLFLQTPYLDVPPAAALLRLCWISSFSWLPKQRWLFCFSPTYLGWRLSWLLLIPAFDGGSYRQYVPLQHPQPTYCGSCSTALLPVILG